MPEERDIYGIEIRTGDAEAALGRLEQRLRQTADSAARAGQGDAAGFRAWRGEELRREQEETQALADAERARFAQRNAALLEEAAAAEQAAPAVAGLTEEERRAGLSAQDLIRNKRGLATAVNLMGGQFGGAIGQVAALLSLLVRGGPQIAAIGGALGALGLAVKEFRDMEAAAKAAADAQDKLNEAVARGQAAKTEPAGRIARALADAGALTDERQRAAEALYGRAGAEYGIAEPELAALAAAAGRGTPADVAVLERFKARAQARGVDVRMRTPLEVAQVLDEIRAGGARGALEAEAAALAAGPAAREVRAGFRRPGARGPAGRSAVEIAFDELSKAGQLPEGVETAAQLSAQLEELRTAPREIEKARQSLAAPHGGDVNGVYVRRIEQLQKMQRERQWIADYIEDIDRAPARQAGTPSAGMKYPHSFDIGITGLSGQMLRQFYPVGESPVGQVIVNVDRVQNVGTIVNDREPVRRRQRPPRLPWAGHDADVRGSW